MPSNLASCLPPARPEAYVTNNSSLSSSSYTSTGLDDGFGFSLRDLIGAIQEGTPCNTIRAYLTHFNERMGSKAIKERLNATIDGYPAIFFVVATGKAEMVKLWACYAGIVDQTYRRVPVLGFAIALCQSFRKNGPLVVKTLLSSGWSVDTIPQAFYAPLQRDLPDDGPPEAELADLEDDNKAWCVPAIRKRIARALNFSFTVRYDLYRASRERAVSGAIKQLFQVHKADELLGIRHFLVGQ